ncbi:MAG: hypothetical protein KJ799_05325 [Bacteroidetes bacterium]|nr:hypothetical protein [Bacteroidota bacterium]MBU1680953.1 hypothetical protein [Bacteroidota bacterium]MBU2506129.1 hypothetical protein [Bacteroidota bacterium]
MKKYISSFVCGFGAGVLQVVPIAKSLSCCLIMPAAVFLALILDRKSKKMTCILETKTAVMIGLFTGLYAALFGTFFDLFITFITKNNDLIVLFPQLQEMISEIVSDTELADQVIAIYAKVIEDIQLYGFSDMYALSVFLSNFIINLIFSLIGALIGVQIINSKMGGKISG